jgi:SAM-dependent methyltransferase
VKRYALEALRCPIDGGPLSVHPFSEHRLELDKKARERCARLGIDPAEAASAVEEGVLLSSSGTWYPIINFVPILLDFATPLHDDFADRHRGEGALRSYEPPSRQPRPGEIWVQRSFTAEWNLLGLDTISFGYSANARDGFVELELDWPPELLESTPRILEIGCGSGFESASLDRVAGGLVYGVDVNLALLGKGQSLAELPFVNDSIASLFALPMRPKYFDLVYSSGVLHHTHSTREAFDSILPHARQGGAVYIWLYSNEDYDDTIGKRANWTAEELLRPQIARLPRRMQQAVVSMLARRHYRTYVRHGVLGRDSWTYEDSEHSVRDRWTPLFAHRHPFKQVIAWFRRSGMDYRPIDPTVYEDRMRVPLIGVGIRGVMPVAQPRTALLLLSDTTACARAGAAAAVLAAEGWGVDVAAPPEVAAALDLPAAVRLTTATARPLPGELPNPPALAPLSRVPWGRIAPSHESLVAAASSDAHTVTVAFDLPALAAAAVGATVHGTRLVYDVGESFAERSQFRQDGLEALLLDLERWLVPYADAVTAASPALAEVIAVRSGTEYPEVVFDPVTAVTVERPLARVFDGDDGPALYWSIPPALLAPLAAGVPVLAAVRGGAADVVERLGVGKVVRDPATAEELSPEELEASTRAAEQLAVRLAPDARARQLMGVFSELAERAPHATDAAAVAVLRRSGERLANEHATILGLIGDLRDVSGKTMAWELARRTSRRAVRGTIRGRNAIQSALRPSSPGRSDGA